MKVLAICDDNDLPESELLCSLAREFQISIIVRPDSSFISKYEAAEICVIPYRISGRVDLKGIRLIRKTLSGFSPQLIHCFSKHSVSNAVLGSLGQKIPILGYRGIVGNLSNWDPSSWISFLNPKITKIACVCKAVEDYLKTFSRLRPKALTIHKGHNLSWYEGEAPKLPDGISIPEGAFVVGCLCNDRPRKGIPVLVQALAKLPLHCHLLMIGRVKGGALKNLVKELGLEERVHFLGFQERGWRYLKHCRVFAMPSLRREGFPKAVIEAMAQGVASVVTKVGGMPEIVVDGECGRVLEPGDVEALNAAIRDYIDQPDLLLRHSEAAKKRISEDFSIEMTVESYQRLYSQLGPKKC